MLLYRPVGLKELELIAESGFRRYPPRLPWQPIFYPVVTREYAREIITQWNQTEQDAGYCGFITEFDVVENYVSKYVIQQLGGGSKYRELWIPAGELELFNDHILGEIRVIDSVYGPNFSGEIEPKTQLPMKVYLAGQKARGLA